MNSPTQALIDECQRQSENCGYTSTSFAIWLRCLRWIRRFFLTAPVVFGALATWKILVQTSPAWAAVFTLLATVLPATYHALKIDSAIARYRSLAGEFTNLRDRFRMAALIDSEKPFEEFEDNAKPLFDRLENARRPMLTPPEWCFWLARRKHKKGHYHHDYDQPVQLAKISERNGTASEAATEPRRATRS